MSIISKDTGKSPVEMAKRSMLAVSIASLVLTGGMGHLGMNAWESAHTEFKELAKSGGTNKAVAAELKAIVDTDIDKLSIIDNINDSPYFNESQNLNGKLDFKGIEEAYYWKIDDTNANRTDVMGFVAVYLADEAVKKNRIRGPELAYRNNTLYYYIAKPVHDTEGKILGSIVIAKKASDLVESLNAILETNRNKNIIIYQEHEGIVVPIVQQGNIPKEHAQISSFNEDKWKVNIWSEVKLSDAMPTLLMSIMPYASGGLLILLGGFFVNRKLKAKSLKEMDIYLQKLEEERKELERMAEEIPSEVNVYDLEKERLAQEIKQSAEATKTTELDEAIADLDENKFDLTILIPSDMINNSKVSSSEIHNITTQHAYIIGHALGTMAIRKNSSAVIGHDGRAGCDEMASTMITGMREAGCNVVYLKDSNMSLLWAATDKYNAYTSIMIGSDNGDVTNMDIRIALDGDFATRNDIMNINEIIVKKDFTKGNGTLNTDNPSANYIEEIQGDLAIDSDIKVAVEASHNSVSSFVMDLYREYGCEVYCAGGEVGSFNQEQGIEQNYLLAVGNLIREKGLDVGFAYDRDADRIRVIDDKGHVLPVPVLSSLLTKHILEESPGSTIVMDISSGLFVESQIRKNFGNVLYSSSHLDEICKIGKEIDSPFGLNFDGKYNYRDRWHGRADGIYVTSRIMEILSITGQKLSELIKGIQSDYARLKTFKKLLRVEHAQGVFLVLTEGKSNFRTERIDNVLLVDFGRASAYVTLRDKFELDIEIHAWNETDLETSKILLQDFIKERKSDLMVQL